MGDEFLVFHFRMSVPIVEMCPNGICRLQLGQMMPVSLISACVVQQGQGWIVGPSVWIMVLGVCMLVFYDGSVLVGWAIIVFGSLSLVVVLVSVCVLLFLVRFVFVLG